MATELGMPSSEHAWMLDTLRAERELGLTLVPSVAHLSSDVCKYSLADSPGLPTLSKGLLSVASMADAVVLVVPAPVGEFEACVASGVLKELAHNCFMMGVKHMVVWVNKMDDESVQYSSERFQEIQEAVTGIVKSVGYGKQKDKGREVDFVPISGLNGENLATKSPKVMPWYGGLSAMDALDALGPMTRPADKPLRLPVLKVRDIPGVGMVVEGRVETGSIRKGAKVLFAPGGYRGEVESLYVRGAEAGEGKVGDVVSFAVGGDIRIGEVRRGSVASSAGNDPAQDADSFLAQVRVMDHPGCIRAGSCPAIAVGTALIPCEFEELIAKLDKTGKEAEAKPERIRKNEAVTVKLRPRKPVCVEQFSAYPALGRFSVREGGRTVAVGVIKEVTKRPLSNVKRDDENEYFS